jgi:hypothetical protein
MENAIAVDQHRSLREPITLPRQTRSQGSVGAAIADGEPGDAGAQFAELGEMAAEGAAAVEHQHRSGGERWGHRGGFGRMAQRFFPTGILLMAPDPLGRIRDPRILGPLKGVLQGVAQKLLPGLLQGVLLLTLLLSGLALAPAAWADTQPSVSAYRCDGDPLSAERVPGAVDATAIPNTLAGTVPGAYLVLHWRGVQLQLPRTNNAGAPSYSDGKWAWSEEDPDHPVLRLRTPGGGVQAFRCETPA